MIEDPLIFAALGANWFIIVGVRITLGTMILAAVSLIYKGENPCLTKSRRQSRSIKGDKDGER
jgi:hypothetical protein